MGQLEEYAKQKKQQEFHVDGQEEELFHENAVLEDYFEAGEESFYDKQKSRGLGEDAEEPELAASYVKDNIQQKLNQTTFAERTEYYFEDPKYMEAKKERYKSLGSKENHELDEYAKKHTNRSASKRKDKANDAADCFEKARKLEEKQAKKEAANAGKAPKFIDTYKAREEIMRARLDGMIYAAKAKSTSSKNEEYRIAKAKLSCLSVLLDQANMLKSEKEAAAFAKVEKGLKKEIASAEKQLAKYAPDVNEQWQESMGLSDENYVKEKTAEAKKKYPYVDEEDIKLQTLTRFASVYEDPGFDEAIEKANEANAFGYKITKRGDEIQSVMNYVKRDKNGIPINKEELKKDQWNKKWMATCVDPEKTLERRQMILEAYQRYERLEFPTPEEIKKKGIAAIYKEKTTVCMEIVGVSHRLDNLGKKAEPFALEYFNANPVFRAKMEMGRCLGWMIQKYLHEVHGITESRGAAFDSNNYTKLQDRDEDEKEDYENAMEDLSTTYSITYGDFLESQKDHELLRQNDAKASKENRAIGLEEWKKDPANLTTDENPVFAGAEEGYKVYKAFREANMVMENPYYIEGFKRAGDKFGDDITRTLGFMLRECSFDRNWIPLTQKDMDAHIWNLKVLSRVNDVVAGRTLDANLRMNIEKYGEDDPINQSALSTHKENMEKSRAELLSMVKEEMDKTFGNMTDYPAPETIENEFVLPLQKGEKLNAPCIEKYLADIGGYAQLSQHFLGYEVILKMLPEANDYLKEHPEYEKRFEATLMLNSIIDTYCEYKYHVLPDSGGINTKPSAKSPDEPEYLAVLMQMLEEYREKLDELK